MRALSAVFLLLCSSIVALSQNAPVRLRQEQSLGNDVAVREIAPGIWLHRSVSQLGSFGLVSSNGVIVVGKSESVLIDTPATVLQTERLLEWAESIKRPIRHALFTHAHTDRIGGIDAVHARHIRTYALPLTIDLAKRDGYAQPQQALPTEGKLQLAGIDMEVFYPGAGHSPDNIVVYVPSSKVLFGGCFLKGTESSTLGNVAEADVKSWQKGLTELIRRYANADIVIPGHGAVAGSEPLQHTLKLVNSHLMSAKANGSGAGGL